jgi:anaerobic magnesium-protoporphyrin IX monomethyl ester cyclase
LNIITLNPPFHPKYSRSQRSPAVIKSGVVYYPIWLSYATGALEQDGFNVKLIDAPASGTNLDAVLEHIDNFHPRLLVMDTSTPSIYNDLDVAVAVKDRCPDIFTVLVGPHASASPEESLKIGRAIDAVAIGEYDYTVRDIARWLDGGGDISSILGINYRDEAGEIFHNPPRPFIKDLDSLPFVSEVYKRHLNVGDYFYSITRYPEVAIITGRGCPYHCTYCLWPQTLTGHGYRKRSVENVADEFDFIAKELPEVKEIFIEDDTLTVDQRRSIALASELIQRGNKLPFTANSRADVKYETLHALRQAGLRLVCVGFESGDQQILDAIKKQITVQQFYDFREAARQAKVLVHGCFMAGNPGETRATLEKTLALSKKLNPDTAQFFPLMVYPGTEAYEWTKRNGFLSSEDYRDWLTPDGLHRSVVTYPDFTAEDLVDWCDSARKSFYLRPRYIVNKIWEMISRPKEIIRLLKAFRTFIRYLFRPSYKRESL